MKKHEIVVGGHYQARISGNFVTVKVESIRQREGYGTTRDRTVYDVLNLKTGRRTTFDSAAKFRKEVKGTVPPSVRFKGGNEEDQMAPESSEGEHSADPTPVDSSHQRISAGSCPRCGQSVTIANGRYDYHRHPTRIITCGMSGERVDPPFVPIAAPSAVASTPVLTNGLLSNLHRVEDTAPHVIIEARAGTGKTTTLVAGLQILNGLEPTDARGNVLTPSPQQSAVWEAIAQSKGKARSCCFVAFNKSIATELQSRVPKGCDAMTMHSLGLKAVTKALGRLEISQFATQDIIAELMCTDLREIRKDAQQFAILRAVEELVSLCKMNLIGLGHGTSVLVVHWEEELSKLCSHYEVELNGNRRQVFEMVPKVLERCKTPSKIGFDDMIWLPVVLNLPVFKYDLLLVDEAQDLNRCQQALAKKAGKRLILCGDPKQAIYGFAGADSDSMNRMSMELGETERECPERKLGSNHRHEFIDFHFSDAPMEWSCRFCGLNKEKYSPKCITLPLTVTRRCGKRIVAEAQRYVPDFSAHESNPEGSIEEARYPVKATNDRPEVPWEQSYGPSVRPGDMVLCRVNAPLVSQCFQFLQRGIKATIQGRDIGQGLTSTVKKVSRNNESLPVTSLIQALEVWGEAEISKERAKKQPNESRIIAVQDRVDCLLCFASDAKTAGDVLAKIASVFTDDKNAPGVRLSSIHKAKGLEAHRVYFLMPKGGECPHPMAKSAWQREQEVNLLYVGITRAIEVLTFVY